MQRFIRPFLSNSIQSRWHSTMSGAVSMSPFSQAVVNAMRKLYPESLADKSFDNTGLLLEAPYNPKQQLKNSVLLTIDLTKAVADEAIARRDSIIVTYHPIIFRGLKSFTLQDPQQTSLLRLAQEGISVYSPHTAVDAVPDGMADWLCDILTGSLLCNTDPLSWTKETEPLGDQSLNVIYPKPARNNRRYSSSCILSHTRKPVHPSPDPIPDGFEGAGVGRILTFDDVQPLPMLIYRVAGATGNPAALSVAIPQDQTISSMEIRTVGICAGSGGSVLMKGPGPLPDLLLTGELSHHEALAAIESGSAVITLFHSNTERGYLHDVMREKLSKAISQELDSENVATEDSLVAISRADRDPFGIMLWK